VPVVFTIIPTKELVYEKRVRKEGIPIKQSYETLVRSERLYITELSETLKSLPNCKYVDVLAPMEQAAMTRMPYPSNGNGHPIAVGYDVLARVLALQVGAYLHTVPTGLATRPSASGQLSPVLVEDDGYWLFSRNDLVLKNGWNSLSEAKRLTGRDLAGSTFKGFINKVDSDRYGPEAFR
jgi:hypothetical protein